MVLWLVLWRSWGEWSVCAIPIFVFKVVCQDLHFLLVFQLVRVLVVVEGHTFLPSRKSNVLLVEAEKERKQPCIMPHACLFARRMVLLQMVSRLWCSWPACDVAVLRR